MRIIRPCNAGETAWPSGGRYSRCRAGAGRFGDPALLGTDPIRITGIRPGEKLHETLITHEEAEWTVRTGEFIFLAPMLPEFLDRRPQTESTRLQSELSSNSDVLDFDETVSLLRAWQVDRWETALE